VTSTRLRSAAVPLLVLLLLVSTSCSSDPSRGDVLAELASDGIVPMYEQLEQNAGSLVGTTVDVCDRGGAASLADAHAALADTRDAWSRTEAAWVGPVMNRRSWAVVDWPINTDEIEELIADDSIALDADRLGKTIGADQRGLGALEYLLGEPGVANDPLVQFGSRRCDYIVGLAQVIHNESRLLLNNWVSGDNGEDPYMAQISAEGSTALDSLINDTLFLLEDIGDRELGVALGVMGGDADIERVVEGASGLATADIVGHLAGLRTVLIGDPAGGGLSPLLGDEITSRLSGKFDVADSAAAMVGFPLREAVTATPTQVEALREAVKAIQVTVATEVVSRLGVTIGFSDADGDTGA
jgi:predicted lipoprotein